MGIRSLTGEPKVLRLAPLGVSVYAVLRYSVQYWTEITAIVTSSHSTCLQTPVLYEVQAIMGDASPAVRKTITDSVAWTSAN